MASLLSLLSTVFGCSYTLAWSASFYPQPLLNLRRRSTAGTTADFPLLNALGFAAYAASTAALLLSADVRAQYAARNHGLAPTARGNDLAFAVHACALSLLTLSQYLLGRRLWRFGAAQGARPSRLAATLVAACLFVLGLTALLVVSDAGVQGPEAWCALDLVYALGYVKLILTLVKFTPQVLANWRNRSTAGWHIGQILLDVAGGLLSVAQQALDSWLQRDWSGITGNPVKFALGNVSFMYDAIFITQHYVLYRHADDARSARRLSSEHAPLLEGIEDGQQRDADALDAESQRHRRTW